MSAKDPGCERALHNGFSTIWSSAAFLFCNLFECCYLRTYWWTEVFGATRKQHLVGEDREPKLWWRGLAWEFQDVKKHVFISVQNWSLWRKGTQLWEELYLWSRVAIALWRLATNGDYSTIAHLFGVFRASVYLIVRDVCDAIVQVLLPKYIQTPHGERLQSIVDGFASKWGFPQCVGAIDGSHIPIVSPLDCPAD